MSEAGFHQLVRAAVALVPAALAELRHPAERYAGQEIDALSRMNEALVDVETIHDEFPDSSVIDREQADRLDEALCSLAALAIAQIALTRAQHPHLREDRG